MNLREIIKIEREVRGERKRREERKKERCVPSQKRSARYLIQPESAMSRAFGTIENIYSTESRLKYAGAKRSEETLFLSFSVERKPLPILLDVSLPSIHRQSLLRVTSHVRRCCRYDDGTHAHETRPRLESCRIGLRVAT